LDVGCNDGVLTRGIAEHYKFDPNNVYGIDVKVWSGRQNVCGLKNMFFVDENNPKLPYPDNHFDLITCFQVLHHAAKPQETVNELRRVLKRGGFLVLKEHDMLYNSPLISSDLIHFEHIVYMCTEEEKVDIEKYRGDYKSKHEWNKMIRLKIVRCISSNNITRYYTCGYTK
jgi:ubiquinone/menaquinone biosynthesis C-methylase UbiE